MRCGGPHSVLRLPRALQQPCMRRHATTGHGAQAQAHEQTHISKQRLRCLLFFLFVSFSLPFTAVATAALIGGEQEYTTVNASYPDTPPTYQLVQRYRSAVSTGARVKCLYLNYVSSPPVCLPLELINHRPLLSTLASLFPPSLDM